MHFGLIIYGQLDYPSGGFLYDRMLVEHLQSHGHRVSIFAQPWASTIKQFTQNWNRKLLSEILATDLDVLIEDELNHASLFQLNRRLRAKSSLPIVSLVHHLSMSENNGAGPISRAIESSYLNSVDAFLVNSASTAETLQPWIGAGRTVQVAQPGGDRLGAVKNTDFIRKRAHEEGPLRLLFIGSISTRKQPQLILEALNQLPKENVQASFAGDLQADAGYLRRFRASVQRFGLGGQVRLLGHVGRDQLVSELRQAQVFVLPSSYEGFGIAYLEAMAFGLPAIAMNWGGAAEIIEDGVSGCLLDKVDAADLAQRIENLANDRERLARMGVAARERFASFPTWEESMKVAEDFLVGLVEQRGAGGAH